MARVSLGASRNSHVSKLVHRHSLLAIVLALVVIFLQFF